MIDTCSRIRRVKCGEEKPKCLRCTSTGRKCEYESTTSHLVSSSFLANPLSLYSSTVSRERRAFAYYFQHAAASIGGGLDADFWHTIVPQVCRTEPAVWDAMISISSLFESPSLPDISSTHTAINGDYARAFNQNQRDALDWYARSVSAVRQGIDRGGVDIFVGLITCVLFICIESILGNPKEALHLYGQGVHLILALQAQKSCVTATEISLLKNTIIPIFVRLGAVSLHTQVPMSALLREIGHLLTHEFDSLKSAREAIVALTLEIHLFESNCEKYLEELQAWHISQEMMEQHSILSGKLQNWLTSFNKMTDSLRAKDALSPLHVSTGAVLLSFYGMLSVILSVCPSASRVTTDDCTQIFQYIVEQCTLALSGSTRHDGTQPPFTYEIGVGLPLWFTCVRCREPTIRRAALDLLRRAHQIQGLHKRDEGAIVCERIVTIEEMYGMTMSEAQCTTNFPTPPKSDTEPTEQDSYFQAISSPNSPFSMDFKPSTTPSSSPMEIEHKTSTEVLVPQEARIKPLGSFRPCEGFPPGIKQDDVKKWKRSDDQIFLYFSRNQRNQSDNTWQTVYGCAPVGP